MGAGVHAFQNRSPRLRNVALDASRSNQIGRDAKVVRSLKVVLYEAILKRGEYPPIFLDRLGLLSICNLITIVRLAYQLLLYRCELFERGLEVLDDLGGLGLSCYPIASILIRPVSSSSGSSAA